MAKFMSQCCFSANSDYRIQDFQLDGVLFVSIRECSNIINPALRVSSKYRKCQISEQEPNLSY